MKKQVLTIVMIAIVIVSLVSLATMHATTTTVYYYGVGGEIVREKPLEGTNILLIGIVTAFAIIIGYILSRKYIR